MNHLYLDKKGFVTVGVGHFIKNRDAVVSIVLCKTKNNVPAKIASLKEKKDEYDTILKLKSKMTSNRNANFYKAHTTLVWIRPEAILFL